VAAAAFVALFAFGAPFPAVVLAAAAEVALLRFRAVVVPVLAGCALAGLALHLAGIVR